MAPSTRRLTASDREEAFRIATRVLPLWFAEHITRGMSDAELERALGQVLGLFGGSCGPGRLDIVHQRSGLKIWAGWHTVNHVTEPPLFQGRQTVAMARAVYNIPDPEDQQLSLL